MSKPFSVQVACEHSAIVEKAVAILRRTLEECAHVAVEVTADADADVVLRLQPGIGVEGFRIDDGAGDTAVICGNDERGLLYGVGKFLRSSQFSPGRVLPCTWRGVSVPVKPVRGMYFASHFHNWYHDAPVEQVVRYVEELALWGCNTLSVWFDMHHFSSIDSPDAVRMLDRLRTILRAANAVGIGASLTMLGNEAYSSSPEALRADWTDGHDGYFRPPGGHYHVEICPSAPGGLDLILKWREEVLDAFSDVDIEYVWIWPYDQGGCTCSNCAPWGTNGFLRTAKPVAELVRRKLPRAKVVLSTWYFDRFVAGEWAGVDAQFAASPPDWVDYLLIDDYCGFPDYPLTHGVPGGLPAVGFAEISMEGMGPWGGFGANPRPRYWQAYWDKVSGVLSGGFPYSEGIYEDLNKVLTLQWGWAPERSADDIVREYASSVFCPETADDVVAVILMLEEDHGAHVAVTEDGVEYRMGELPRADDCFRVVQRIDGVLPERAKRSWRWRVLWLRAALDAELKRSCGQASETSDAYFDELIEIYHAQNAESPVHPPSRAAIAGRRGAKR